MSTEPKWQKVRLIGKGIGSELIRTTLPDDIWVVIGKPIKPIRWKPLPCVVDPFKNATTNTNRSIYCLNVCLSGLHLDIEHSSVELLNQFAESIAFYDLQMQQALTPEDEEYDALLIATLGHGRTEPK